MEKKRMTERKKYVCKIDCGNCPLSSLKNDIGVSCSNLEMVYPDKAVEIVQRWSDENSGPLAKWEINSDGYYPYCSDCGFEPEKISLYCPNCGKKMINSLELMEKGKLKE